MTRQEVVVVIANDVIVEPDQDFRSRLQLTTVETGIRVEPEETTIVIVDDDSEFNVMRMITSFYGSLDW